MIRNENYDEFVFTNAPQGVLVDMKSACDAPQPKVGTLSFPVKIKEAKDAKTTYHVQHNTSVIVEIVEKRRPDLLLCAGWSVSNEQHLDKIMTATAKTQTVVVLETCLPKRVYFRIADGQKFTMGEQCFADCNEAEKIAGPRCLADSISERSFSFLSRGTLLLICGELMVVHGRKHVEFRQSIPQSLQDAIQVRGVMILNPTHTRMSNTYGQLNAKRRYLSSQGRIYVSASNWAVTKQGQIPSKKLHSFWHNGELATFDSIVENEYVCYREWDVPRSV